MSSSVRRFTGSFGNENFFFPSSTKASTILIVLGLLLIPAFKPLNKTVQQRIFTLDASIHNSENNRKLNNIGSRKTEIILLHVSVGTPRALLSISNVGDKLNVRSQDCREVDHYLCISSFKSADGRKTVFNFRARKTVDTGNVQYFDYQREIRTGSISSVSMKITDNKWIRIYSDGNLLFANRFNSAYGIGQKNQGLELRYSGIPNNEYGKSYFNQQLAPEGGALQITILLLSSILIASGIFIQSKNKAPIIKNSPNVRKLFKTTFLITSVSAIIGLLGFYRRPSVIYDIGIAFEPVVRFSDFFQVWTFSEYNNLYKDIQPDSPPLQILMFKAFSTFIQPEVMFLLLVMISIVVMYFLLNSMLGTDKKFLSLLVTATFYPLLYAIERGSLDLLVFPVLACSMLFYDKKMYGIFSLLIGIIAGLKVLPLIFIVMVFCRSEKLKNTLIAVLTAVLSNCAAALVLPEDGISEITLYTRHLFQSIVDRGSSSNSFPVGDNSLSAFLNTIRYFSPALGTSSALSFILIFSIVSVLGVFIYVTVNYRRTSSEKLGLSALVVMLLIVPNSFNYRLMFFVPMMWFWNRNRSHKNLNDESIWLYVLVGVLLSAHPLIYYENGPGFWGQIMNTPLLVLILIILTFAPNSDGDEISNLSSEKNTFAKIIREDY